MTKTQKVINIIEAIILVTVALVLISVPEIGYGIVVLVLGIGFVIK